MLLRLAPQCCEHSSRIIVTLHGLSIAGFGTWSVTTCGQESTYFSVQAQQTQGNDFAALQHYYSCSIPENCYAPAPYFLAMTTLVYNYILAESPELVFVSKDFFRRKGFSCTPIHIPISKSFFTRWWDERQSKEVCSSLAGVLISWPATLYFPFQIGSVQCCCTCMILQCSVVHATVTDVHINDTDWTKILLSVLTGPHKMQT